MPRNTFVRVILSDAGTKLGGLTEPEWNRTLDFFAGRCAYTGETLLEGRTQRDHAVPMNRAHCGLHLYGNVVPATTESNRRKGDKHYRDFVEDADRLVQIETFIRQSGYRGTGFRYSATSETTAKPSTARSMRFVGSARNISPVCCPKTWKTGQEMTRSRRTRLRNSGNKGIPCQLLSTRRRRRRSRSNCCASEGRGSSRFTGMARGSCSLGTRATCLSRQTLART